MTRVLQTKRWLFLGLVALAAIAAGLFASPGSFQVTSAFGDTIEWVDWTSTTSGSLSGGVTVTHTGASINLNTVSGQWDPAATYESSTVHNAPPCATGDCDQIRLKEIAAHTVVFSSAVTNPVMALWSVGHPFGGGVNNKITYEFDAPFTILSDNSTTCAPIDCGTLTDLGGNVLEGEEGSGVIQFQGTFTSIGWTNPTFEDKHGFTFGVPPDSDNDGVLDGHDVCDGTVLPDVPTRALGVNRWADIDGDGVFETRLPKDKGGGIVEQSHNGRSFTLDDTAGCPATQIIEELGASKGHSKFGASTSVMEDWIASLGS